MATLITGSTGYIGSYVLAGLLEKCDEDFYLLVRNASPERIWKAMQLHLDLDAFRKCLPRLKILSGDIAEERLGLEAAPYEEVVKETTSVLHIAASLNRKSERACMKVNLKGTLGVIQLAAAAHADHGLRRFGHVSTVAVAGRRQDELVEEDQAIDWERQDYDPYARTKKFCEHMLATLLPDVKRTIYRPSVVLGDSRRPETTQFDMVAAFAFLARLPVLPLRKDDRIDIVPTDYVADAIVKLHLDDDPKHEVFNLSAGAGAQTYGEITTALAEGREKSPPWFWSWLDGPFAGSAKLLSSLRGTKVGKAASALEVFMPYLTFNTVFDNARVVEAMGRSPEPFTDYAMALLNWSLEHKFKYPYEEYPG